MSPMRGEALKACLRALELGVIPEERRDQTIEIIKAFPSDQCLPEALVERGVLTREQLDRVLADAAAQGESLGPPPMARTIVSQGGLGERDGVSLDTVASHFPTVGQTWGRFLIDKRLGAGGMGQVFRAKHLAMDRVVALKVLLPEAIDSPAAVHRFRREVKAAARLIHPNIVTAFDADEHEGVHYLVMEYVDGPDLDSLLDQRGPLPVHTAVDYIVQAARGLAYAHSEGVVHRDIKPANLLLDPSGTIKVLDMGLARLGQAPDVVDATATSRLTGSGLVIGTVDYISPEQAEDSRYADHRSDIYSLGCTLYRLLTNQPIYAGDTRMKRLLAHREAAIPSLRAERDDVPAELEKVFQTMVAKKPERRYQSVREVIRELDACRRQIDAENVKALLRQIRRLTRR